MNEKIIEYIRQNQDTYTREAMTEQLVKTGYSEADIEAAFKQLADESDVALHSRRTSRRTRLPTPAQLESHQETENVPTPIVKKRKNLPLTWWDSDGLGCIVYFSLPTIIIFVLIGINAHFAILAGAGSLILGLILPSMLENRAPQFGEGIQLATRLMFVLFIVLPFLAVVVIGGICLVSNIRI